MLNWNCLKVTAPHFTVVIYVYVEPDLNLINASQTVKDLGVTNLPCQMIVCLINTYIMLSKDLRNYVDGYFELSKQDVHY